MACPRCGSNCNCACSGDPLPSQDWRRQISMQVRAHKVRKRRRLDPDSPLLDFDDQDALTIEGNSTAVVRNSNLRWDRSILLTTVATEPRAIEPSQIAEPVVNSVVAVEEPPASVQAERSGNSMAGIFDRPRLPPFPRISTPVPKIIEFPRTNVRPYELAEPIADQLRIFEAIEEVPQLAPSHLCEIEIAPEQPAYGGGEIEVPIQAAPLGMRAYAAAVDAALMIFALGIFGISAEFFANSLPMTKPLLASGAICGLLLLTFYFLLSLSFSSSTAGMEASGLRVITFSGDVPSRMTLRWRALATVLSCAALGMGFAWSLLDEDRLCWHDRITHTYLISK